MKAKLENEVNMDLKSSKISPRELQHETNMDPKGCSGLWRPPSDPWKKLTKMS